MWLSGIIQRDPVYPEFMVFCEHKISFLGGKCPITATAGSSSRPKCNIIRSCQTVFQCGCTILHPNQQCRGDPVSLHLVVLLFFILVTFLPVAPASFVEMTCLFPSPLNCFCAFVKNQLDIVCGSISGFSILFLWSMCPSVSHTTVSITALSLALGKSDASYYTSLFQKHFSYSRSCAFSYKF